jgi:hypothetical protein
MAGQAAGLACFDTEVDSGGAFLGQVPYVQGEYIPCSKLPPLLARPSAKLCLEHTTQRPLNTEIAWYPDAC